MIAGIEHDFGARILVIPPLTLGALEGLQQRLAALKAGEATDPKNIATVIDAAHLALRRNYPELTREQVADLVDLGNMADVLAKVMDVAGVMRKQQEAGAAAGETRPQSVTAPAG